MTQVIHTFRLVHPHDLLEDTRTIDVIITNVPLWFEMVERFKNLDNILRYWAKDMVQKVS